MSGAALAALVGVKNSTLSSWIPVGRTSAFVCLACGRLSQPPLPKVVKSPKTFRVWYNLSSRKPHAVCLSPYACCLFPVFPLHFPTCHPPLFSFPRCAPAASRRSRHRPPLPPLRGLSAPRSFFPFHFILTSPLSALPSALPHAVYRHSASGLHSPVFLHPSHFILLSSSPSPSPVMLAQHLDSQLARLRIRPHQHVRLDDHGRPLSPA